MLVAEYLVSHFGESDSDKAQGFLLKMHERYAQHKARNGFSGADGKYRNLAWFVMSPSTRYALAVGTLVKEKTPSGKFDIAIVSGYSDSYDDVCVETDSGQKYLFDVRLLEKADVPPQILEIARRQLVSECPLLKKGGAGCPS